MSTISVLNVLRQSLPLQIQEMIANPGEPSDDDDRRAPARRALLNYISRAGIQSIEFDYRCDPVVINGDPELHASVRLKSLKTASGHTITSEHVAETPVRKALEGLGFVDVSFAHRFGRVVDNAAHGLYRDEMSEDDEVMASPKAGAAKVTTARGDIMNIAMDDESAQAIFDAMPDPEGSGLLSDGAAMRRRTTTSHRWR